MHDQVGPGGFVLSRTTKIEPDAAAAAAPVRDTSGSVIAALSIIGPSFRLPDDELKRIGIIVAQSAADLSEELGYEENSAHADNSHPMWILRA